MNIDSDLDGLAALVTACCPDIAGVPLVPADEVVIRDLAQEFEARAVVLAVTTVLLWLAPRSTTALDPNEISWFGPHMVQAVLALPEGRYMVDVHDAATGALLSRESAAASPLVIGLPHRNHPLLVRIDLVG